MHNSDRVREALPALPWFTPDTEEYKERRITYCASNPAMPQAILCPHSSEEVSAIVRLAREYKIPLSVRSGGHDIQGRSVVHDALCIDMRGIDFVEVSQDRKTAVIGGGMLLQKLSQVLHEHGLVTPTGSVPSIGYVGWASLGGYGCFSTHFGLGVDQIVEAEVVNDKGDIVNADEQMLRGIRGAGGNFGIITSLRIKVYELKQMLAGMVMFDTAASGISQTFKDVFAKLQDLEEAGEISQNVVLQPLIINHPEAGRSFGLTFVWSSDDHEAGQKNLAEFLEKVPAVVTMNTISPMAPPDWIHMLGNFIAKSVWGGSQALSFGKLSSKILDIIGRGLEAMPSDPGTCFSLHKLSRHSPSATSADLADASCFDPDARQAHTMIEIVGSAVSEEAMEECGRWARSMREELFASGEAMQGTYVSLIGPEHTTLQAIYGTNLELVKGLKQKHDPEGVFRYATPRMLD